MQHHSLLDVGVIDIMQNYRDAFYTLREHSVITWPTRVQN